LTFGDPFTNACPGSDIGTKALPGEIAYGWCTEEVAASQGTSNFKQMVLASAPFYVQAPGRELLLLDDARFALGGGAGDDFDEELTEFYFLEDVTITGLEFVLDGAPAGIDSSNGALFELEDADANTIFSKDYQKLAIQDQPNGWANGTKQVQALSHGLVTGDPIKFEVGTGSLPTGISAGTVYYVGYYTASNFYVFTNYADALAGVSGSRVSFGDDATSGTILDRGPFQDTIHTLGFADATHREIPAGETITLKVTQDAAANIGAIKAVRIKYAPKPGRTALVV
jgi:hypothetical protein